MSPLPKLEGMLPFAGDPPPGKRRLLVKVGGSTLEQADARAELARSLAAAWADGHQILLVHGGGNQMRHWSKRVGLEDHYVQGLRVTDADTADLATMVLGGLVNRQLVASLQQAGVRAVGMTGADGQLFSAQPYQGIDFDSTPFELGYVGSVTEVDPTLIAALWGCQTMPVVATIAPLAEGLRGPSDRFYNINADQVAGPLAKALGCDVVLFLSDVPGVRGASGEPLPQLTEADAQQLQKDQVLTGGMVPKVLAAVECAHCVQGALVKIAAATGPDAVRAALRDGAGTGVALKTGEAIQ